MAFLYYSGHGLMSDLDRESVFLATTDTESGQLHTTALDTAGVLLNLLNATRASQKVVLLDCCFSGAFGARNRFRGGVRQEPRRGIRQQGTFVLTSSNHAKAAKSQGHDRPSLFTEVILAGLRGDAATNGERLVTTNDLARYAQGRLARDPRQRPVESSEGVTEPIMLTTAEATSRSHKASSRPSGADAEFDADQWRKLLRYYVSCIEREGVLESFIELGGKQTFLDMPAGPESVFAGDPALRNASTNITAFGNRAASEGRQLRYGYPTLVQRDKRQASRLWCAPLLVCDITLTSDGGLLPTFPPQPNRALAQELGLSEVEIVDLVQLVEDTFIAGDPGALEETMRCLMKVLGIAGAVSIDPLTISGKVGIGPLNHMQNAAVLFSADPGGKTSKLVKDLRDWMAADPTKINQTALGALTGVVEKDDSLAKPANIVALDRLNESQERVIQAAMTRRLTVAQGPPGTGKSQLVTALTATATAVGQTVLVGSTNNGAVDEVVQRTTDGVGPGLLVRTGNRERMAQEPALLAELLNARVDGPANERTVEAELRLIQQEIAALRTALDKQRLVERDLAELAAERSSHNGAETLLPTNEAELASLVRTADRALRRGVFGWWSRWRLRAFKLADSAAIEEFAQRATLELRWLGSQRLNSELGSSAAAWSRLVELGAVERPKRSKQLLLAQLARRIRAGTGILRFRADEMSKSPPRGWARFRELLCTLPAWATTAPSARALPPQPALFDLVIIDEAAQCSIASILPMLHRAKRALIIGDPRQLSPIHTLPESEDFQRQAEAGLSSEWLESRRLVHTRHSGYDAFAATAGHLHLLDEHYRCHPAIIAGPNRDVYQGRLTVLTDTAKLAAPAESPVRWQHIDGVFTPGERSSGANQPELIAVVAQVQELRAAFPHATVGVVTPLAAQRSQITRALKAAGLAESEVVCGTIHRFQGSERDIMVISPVGAHGVRKSTQNWLVGAGQSLERGDHSG